MFAVTGITGHVSGKVAGSLLAHLAEKILSYSFCLPVG